MGNILFSVMALAAIALVLGVLGWIIRPRANEAATNPSSDDTSPTASDIGAATGLLGGNIADAAVAQYALQHKENATGEPATKRDAVMVAAMQQATKKP